MKNKIIDFYLNICIFFINMKLSIKHFFRWLQKCFQYSIFLWHDEDWDYVYILKLLDYKLNRVKKNILKNNLIIETDEIAKEISYAQSIIKRIVQDDYLKEEFENFFLQFHKEIFDKDGNYIHMLNYEKKKFNVLTKKENKLRQKDYNDLFAFLKNNITKWWD